MISKNVRFTGRSFRENDQNRWKINGNFENERNNFFERLKTNLSEMGRSRTMNERKGIS